MGLRFRKSVKICKGVSLNFSKSGVGLSLGVRGARYTIGADGRKTVTLGVPGTGLSYTKTSSRHQEKPKKQIAAPKNAGRNLTVQYENGETHTYTPNDVLRYREVIRILTKAHVSCSAPVHWEALRDAEPPFPKDTMGPLEARARSAYNAMTPTPAEKLFPERFEQRKIQEYEKVEQAKLADAQAYDAWEASRVCAASVLSGDVDAYCDAVSAADPFVDLSRIGCDFEFGTDAPSYMEVEFRALLDDLIPREKLELTAAGNVSRKLLSKTEMYAIALDYVCSCAIRLARELFALLPVETVVVHAVREVKDGLGAVTEATILSVKFGRDVFEKTDFTQIDASDFVETFLHNLSFRKTQGFRPVEPLTPETVNAPPRLAPGSGTAEKGNVQPAGVDLPSGWYTQNEKFLKPRDDKLYALMKKANAKAGISDEIATLKELIAHYTLYEDECAQQGIAFERYFAATHMYSNGQKKDYVNGWKMRLDALEESFLDVKEAEDAVALARPTIKADLVSLISANPGIRQKELYEKFSPWVKQLILDTLYELLKEGTLTKEKDGNSNKLYIAQGAATPAPAQM